MSVFLFPKFPLPASGSSPFFAPALKIFLFTPVIPQDGGTNVFLQNSRFMRLMGAFWVCGWFCASPDFSSTNAPLARPPNARFESRPRPVFSFPSWCANFQRPSQKKNANDSLDRKLPVGIGGPMLGHLAQCMRTQFMSPTGNQRFSVPLAYTVSLFLNLFLI